MFDLFKFVLLAAGCAAIYGLATGADLNELFKEITEKAVPVVQSILSGIWDLIRSAISK
jgi:hypothetical protein